MSRRVPGNPSISGPIPKACRFCGTPCRSRSRGAPTLHGCYDYRRDRTMRENYGLSIEEADTLIAQGCSLCGQEAHHIDHCHDTGVVRGALCVPHNRALGTLGDDVSSVLTVLAYLKGEPHGYVSGKR